MSLLVLINCTTFTVSVSVESCCLKNLKNYRCSNLSCSNVGIKLVCCLKSDPVDMIHVDDGIDSAVPDFSHENLVCFQRKGCFRDPTHQKHGNSAIYISRICPHEKIHEIGCSLFASARNKREIVKSRGTPPKIHLTLKAWGKVRRLLSVEFDFQGD